MMQNIEALERRLWSAADQLRANSGLGSNEYFMPVLGVLFLRHAYTRYAAALPEVEASLPSRGGQKRAMTKDDFTKRRSIFLRLESQYGYLLELPGDANIGRAINHAMDLIELDYEGLRGILPRNFEGLSDDLLRALIRIFNDEALRKATGDVFGRIYEYFLMKFSMQGAHDNGEFFTPPSIVQMIVNVIEPDHGKIFDPACGSGGMFVQTSHFIEGLHKDVSKAVTFYGQEKNETTIRIAKMNLAVHGLEGAILRGNTFTEDHHEMLGKADFVMANPPFNVDGVDSEKIKKDPRLPFGLPGVNKNKVVSNANYLWMSYFYSYLNDKGRAGFVMSSQASSAGHDEATVRRKIVETGHVDVMVAIRSNFFYTRSVPCELWFYDKGKPKEKKDKVLMIDARNIHRKVTRKIFDFSPEQLNNLSAILWLYRGESEKYLTLVGTYLERLASECAMIPHVIKEYEAAASSYVDLLGSLLKVLGSAEGLDPNRLAETKRIFAELQTELRNLKNLSTSESEPMGLVVRQATSEIPQENNKQKKLRERYDEPIEGVRSLIKRIEHFAKYVGKSAVSLKALIDGKNDLNDANGRREVARKAKDFLLPQDDSDEETLLSVTMAPLREAVYLHRHIVWLQERFPEARYADVEGLVKLVSRKAIEKNDWSLTPGRYVGVAPLEEAEGFDFADRLREIHEDLEQLDNLSTQLTAQIQKNFEGFGI